MYSVTKIRMHTMGISEAVRDTRLVKLEKVLEFMYLTTSCLEKFSILSRTLLAKLIQYSSIVKNHLPNYNGHLFNAT